MTEEKFQRNFFLIVGIFNLLMWFWLLPTYGHKFKQNWGQGHSPRRPVLITCKVEDPSDCTTVREFDGNP